MHVVFSLIPKPLNLNSGFLGYVQGVQELGAFGLMSRDWGSVRVTEPGPVCLREHLHRCFFARICLNSLHFDFVECLMREHDAALYPRTLTPNLELQPNRADDASETKP